MKLVKVAPSCRALVEVLIKKCLIYLSYAHALSQFKLLFCVTLLNTLSEEKKESGEPYRFGKIPRAHYIFSLFYPGVRIRLLAFIVAFAAVLFPQQGQCNTTLCQLTVVKLGGVRFKRLYHYNTVTEMLIGLTNKYESLHPFPKQKSYLTELMFPTMTRSCYLF